MFSIENKDKYITYYVTTFQIVLLVREFGTIVEVRKAI